MVSIMTNRNERDKSEKLTPREASLIAGLTPAGLAKMANFGKLTVSKPGGTHRRYLRSEIEALATPSTPTTGAEATK